FTADSKPMSTSEQADSSSAAAGGAPATAAPATAAPASGDPAIPANFTSTGPYVDLWDLGRPNSRYWWTAVPVRIIVVEGTVKYEDETTPQDACQAGAVKEFARTSQPTTTSSTKPAKAYASGLSAFGVLFAAKTTTPSFYRSPLVAWQPAKAAVGYEVQWSHTRSPWQSKGSVFTAATSTVLDQLTPGTWYYRVRGIDPYVPGPLKQMAWSTPVKITMARPKFFDQSGVSTHTVKK